jgi:hypothetical protein
MSSKVLSDISPAGDSCRRFTGPSKSIRQFYLSVCRGNMICWVGGMNDRNGKVRDRFGSAWWRVFVAVL